MSDKCEAEGLNYESSEEMKDKTGKNFESLVGKIYELLSSSDNNTKVQIDVELDSPDGPRQFDVVIEGFIAGNRMITVVEVRDWNKNLSVTHVDGLHSKIEGVDADKAILVARKGFSSGARKKAKRVGIHLCTAHDLENINDFVHKAPVVVHHLNFAFSTIECSYNRFRPTLIDYSKFMLGESVALNVFRSNMADRTFVPKVCMNEDQLQRLHEEAKQIVVGAPRLDISKYGEYLNVWTPPKGTEVTYHDPETGSPVEVQGFKVMFVMKFDYYFGYLNDLPGTFALDNISAAHADLFFLDEDIYNFEKHFSRYSKLAEIPVDRGVSIFSIAQLPYEKFPSQRI